MRLCDANAHTIWPSLFSPPFLGFARRATARHRLKSAGHRHRLFMSPKTAAPYDGDGSLLQPDPPKGVAHDSRPHRCAPHALAHLTHAPYAFNQLPLARRSYKCLMNTIAAATHIVHCAPGALAEKHLRNCMHPSPYPASCAPPHSRRTHAARIVARCPDINAQTTETDSPNMQAADPPQPHGGQLAVVGPGMLARTPSLPQPGPQRAPLDVFII